MSSKPFNVAIVGYGMSAKVFHIPLILVVPDLALYGIVQRSPKPHDDASKDHPGVKTWRSVDDVYQDKDVDVVILTTVPESHYDLCKSALEAGKHVVVEKPFVTTSLEATKLIEIAKMNGKLLTVYQNRRWDTDYLTVQKVLPDPPPDTWKAKDGPAHGSIYDLGTHTVDQVYNTFEMPKRITGFIEHQRRTVQGGPHDSHTLLLHYDGTLVTVKAAVISPEIEQLRFWIRGTRGSFRKFGLDSQEDQLKAGGRPGDTGFGVDPESNYGTLTTMVDGKPLRQTYPTVKPLTYADFYRKFAKALHGQGEVPVKPEDARDCLIIIELVFQSSKEGRTIDVRS